MTRAPRRRAETPAAAQETRDAFEWSGRVEPGCIVHVKNMNGAIRVERGDDVEIVARKRWRRGNPEEVRVELQRVGGGDVLVCALWRDGTCSETSYRGRRGGGPVPAKTVNGSITVRMGSMGREDIRFETVLGKGGPRLEARTVNGSVGLRRGN